MSSPRKGRSLVRFTRRSIHYSRVDSVAVLGLGRFGAAVALELMNMGTDVLGIDANEDKVQRLNGQLTHVVRADTTDEVALAELNVHDFERVVVAIGSHLEASILTASLVLQEGVDVWAKATSFAHGRILEQLGVQHVIYPETEMGKRVAHRVRGALLDFIETGTDFALVRTKIPSELAGGTLDENAVWNQHKVKIVAVKSPSQGWIPVRSNTLLNDGDLVQVVGKTADVETFATLL